MRRNFFDILYPIFVVIFMVKMGNASQREHSNNAPVYSRQRPVFSTGLPNRDHSYVLADSIPSIASVIRSYDEMLSKKIVPSEKLRVFKKEMAAAINSVPKDDYNKGTRITTDVNKIAVYRDDDHLLIGYRETNHVTLVDTSTVPYTVFVVMNTQDRNPKAVPVAVFKGNPTDEDSSLKIFVKGPLSQPTLNVVEGDKGFIFYPDGTMKRNK